MTLQMPVKTPGTRILVGTHTCMYIHIRMYIYNYIYICVCVYVYIRMQIACLPCMPFKSPFLAESPCLCAGDVFSYLQLAPLVHSWCLRCLILHNHVVDAKRSIKSGVQESGAYDKLFGTTFDAMRFVMISWYPGRKLRIESMEKNCRTFEGNTGTPVNLHILGGQIHDFHLNVLLQPGLGSIQVFGNYT